MDEEAKRIFRLTQMECEEAMNEIITCYLKERQITDGEAELITMISRGFEERYQAFCQGELSELLAAWRHRRAIN